MSSKVFFAPADREDGPKLLSEKIKSVYMQLGLHDRIEEEALIGIKIHFGEKGNTGYIKPQWLKDVIRVLRARSKRVFLTDTNTLYVGSRSNSVDHLHLAYSHDFHPKVVGVPVIIADGLIGRNDDEIEVDLPLVKRAKIASAFLNTDVLICMNHFTGHIVTGFGSALKNLGMGCASRAGKLEQHSDLHPHVNPDACKKCGTCLDFCPSGAMREFDGLAFIEDEKCIGCGECLVVCSTGAITLKWDRNVQRVQEKMAEYAWSVKSLFGDKIGFINVVLQVSKDCDCMSRTSDVIAPDVGIFGSLDPVAVDKACVDRLLDVSGNDVLRSANDVDWKVQLAYGEKIGLGSMVYELIELK
jgi:uncharacterized Fe-S center protein